MPIHHAVLALLTAGPSYGYQLKGAFEAAIGPQWGPLNIGHLYQVLDRLSRDRMVVSNRHPQSDRPDRVVYAITPTGTSELARWLAEPSRRGGGFRDDFFLKVAAAARSSSVAAVRAVLTNQRTQLLRELRGLADERHTAADALVELLLSAATRRVEADLAFVDDVEATLLAGDGKALDELRVAEAGDAAEERPPDRAA